MGHGLSPRTVVGEGKESTNARTLKPKIASEVLQLGGWGVLSSFVMNTRVKVLEDFFWKALVLFRLLLWLLLRFLLLWLLLLLLLLLPSVWTLPYRTIAIQTLL